jgi:hypothetical protein
MSDTDLKDILTHNTCYKCKLVHSGTNCIAEFIRIFKNFQDSQPKEEVLLLRDIRDSLKK